MRFSLYSHVIFLVAQYKHLVLYSIKHGKNTKNVSLVGLRLRQSPAVTFCGNISGVEDSRNSGQVRTKKPRCFISGKTSFTGDFVAS